MHFICMTVIPQQLMTPLLQEGTVRKIYASTEINWQSYICNTELHQKCNFCAYLMPFLNQLFYADHGVYSHFTPHDLDLQDMSQLSVGCKY